MADATNYAYLTYVMRQKQEGTWNIAAKDESRRLALNYVKERWPVSDVEEPHVTRLIHDSLHLKKARGLASKTGKPEAK